MGDAPDLRKVGLWALPSWSPRAVRGAKPVEMGGGVDCGAGGTGCRVAGMKHPQTSGQPESNGRETTARNVRDSRNLARLPRYSNAVGVDPASTARNADHAVLIELTWFLAVIRRVGSLRYQRADDRQLRKALEERRIARY